MKIDLEEKMDMPPETLSPSSYFPTIHITQKEEIELPDEGILTVAFKKIRSEESDSEDRGKRYSCVLELHEIQKVKAEAGVCSGPEDEDGDEYDKRGSILDKLREELDKESD